MQLGIARTFQINQLFADLTPLETIGLAVSERHGLGRRLVAHWSARSRDRRSRSRSRSCERFRLADVMDERTANLPYGKQRLLEIALAIACRPRVLLLDEPAAGVPEAERHDILDTVAALPDDVTVLLIEHDMDIVFSFADRISVLVNGALFVEGPPEEVARDPRVKAVYLGEDSPCLSFSPIESLSAGYGEAVVLSERLALARRRPVAGAARPQRHGQDHAGQLDRRRHALSRRHASGSAGATSRATARRTSARMPGVGWVPQERNIFKSLTVEENLTAVARPGPWTTEQGLRACSRGWPSGARNLGNQLSGGEQQMLAIGRALILNPRIILLDEPLEGLAPIIVEELLARAASASSARRACRRSWSSRTPRRSSASPTAPPSSSAARIVHQADSADARDRSRRCWRSISA